MCISGWNQGQGFWNTLCTRYTDRCTLRRNRGTGMESTNLKFSSVLSALVARTGLTPIVERKGKYAGERNSSRRRKRETRNSRREGKEGEWVHIITSFFSVEPIATPARKWRYDFPGMENEFTKLRNTTTWRRCRANLSTWYASPVREALPWRAAGKSDGNRVDFQSLTDAQGNPI